MRPHAPHPLTVTAPSKPPIHLMLRGRMAAAVRTVAQAEGITPGEAARRLLAQGYRLQTGRVLGGEK